MKKNEFVLPLIIILLIIFLPCSIYGVRKKIIYEKEHGNPTHLHKLGNTLYYYNGKKLVGTYECKNTICNDATPQIDDKYLRYKDYGNKDIGIINGQYVFIQDGDEVKFIGLKSGKKSATEIVKFAAIKNYGTNIANNYFIVKDSNDSYQLFNANNVSYVFENKYQYIGISQNYIGSSQDTMKYAVEDNYSYYILDSVGTKKTSGFEYPIYDYDDDYVYLIDNETYFIYNYENERVLEDISISKIDFLTDNTILTSTNGGLYIYDKKLQNKIKEYVGYGSNYTYKEEDGNLTIYNNDVKVDSIDLNSENKKVENNDNQSTENDNNENKTLNDNQSIENDNNMFNDLVNITNN